METREIPIDWGGKGRGDILCPARFSSWLCTCMGCGHFRGFRRQLGQDSEAHSHRPIRYAENGGEILWRADSVRCAFAEEQK